jgi:hypothetical protein
MLFMLLLMLLPQELSIQKTRAYPSNNHASQPLCDFNSASASNQHRLARGGPF